MKIRKAADRGYADHGWLKSYHTFSFSDYYDPDHMGFRSLRVINEDRVSPGQGFPTHPHQNMEIVSYVLEGALEHQDSMGNGSVIRPGDVQRMSAGSGVAHSEYNHSDKDSVHFLQIWILPGEQGIQTSYEQKHFSEADKQDQLRLVASPDGRENSVTIHQDAQIFASVLDAGAQLSHQVPPNRHAWIQVVRGNLNLNGEELAEGDGVEISEPINLEFNASKKSEFLLFDLA